jgi:hypothetical protein
LVLLLYERATVTTPRSWRRTTGLVADARRAVSREHAQTADVRRTAIAPSTAYW